MKKEISKVAIIVNGAIDDYPWTRQAMSKCDYIIAVDGGSNHLAAMAIIPDLIVGDLDSIDPAAKDLFEQQGCSFMTFPPAKDQSDLQLALEHAVSLQPQSIQLFGALGKRFDHAYGNVLLLALIAGQNITVLIEDEIHAIQVISGRADFPQMVGDTLSLFSLSTETTGIVTQGMAYPLREESLYAGDTRGLSNEIKDPDAAVSLQTGMLLAIRIKSKPTR